ncbi:MAG: MFS transporter [Vulcanisaeta sp.]|uniref:Major facilitator superfamily MFS_1 n=1 Tax=Vulcanisaeta moutnovskia (strain 768-28) TaxID=985053 RepID=F0QTS9_VULM7|nr:MFS transporter [Vulcanisaeta moutnovskia]ADY00545.1 major facilitator superfamily MFS_1 [Vulcanisaeta moutnovskia 768-28]
MRRNAVLLIASRAIRSLAFGYLTFIVPLYLKSIGFSAVIIGLYFLVATISSAILVLISGFLGDMIGRRDALIIMSSLFIISMVIFSITNNKVLLFLTSVFGTTTGSMGGGGAGGGPVTPLQTSLLADNTELNERTRIFSLTTSISLLSSLLGSLISYAILSLGFSDLVLFRISLVLSIISLMLLVLISRDKPRIKSLSINDILPRRSSKPITRIAIAGSLGSLGLGMVTPLLPLWFRLFLNASEIEINEVYTASYVVSIILTLMARRIEVFMGRVRAISILRSISVFLFIVMALMPVFMIDAVLYVIRVTLYTITIPLRQSLSMDLMDENERARGLSITGLARRVPYGLGSTIAGLLMNYAEFSLSMVLGGGIALLDPILYYIFFRHYDDRSSQV